MGLDLGERGKHSGESDLNFSLCPKYTECAASLLVVVHWRGDFGFGLPEEVRSLHLWRSIATG